MKRGGWRGLKRLPEGGRVVVLGAGRSGVAAARLLLVNGFRVSLHDQREWSEADAAAYEAQGLDQPVSDEPPEWGEDVACLCVTSPGFAKGHPWLRGARDAGVPVVGELELGSACCECPIVAVTGTNGKTTCVELIHQLLAAAGKHVEEAGNIGRPLCEAALQSHRLDWLVVEVSSFQLETVVHFHPRVSVLLNIQPDHLDRHRGMDEYARLKSALFDNQVAGDVAFVDAGRVGLVRELTRGSPRWYGVGGEGCPVSWRPGMVRIPLPDGTFQELPIDGSVLDNAVTGPAVAASVAVLAACTEMPINGWISELIRDFQPAAHRYEAVGEVGGVSFIDDSKATNLAAMMAALERTDRPVRLIAGGLFKEKEPEIAKEVLARRAVCVYLIGRDAERLAAAWSDVVRCVPCGTMDVAVREAWAAAATGDVVLLSPACASFDQYRGYGARGEAFRNIVEGIKKEA